MAPEAAIREFPSRKAMAQSLADEIESRIVRAIEKRGAASMALSGGSTPADLYRALSAKKLDWTRVTAALVDERWVPPEAEGSNESFLRSTLQQGNAANVRVVGMWSDAPSPAEGLAETEKRYGSIQSPFDIVVLGMGADGHTASWFPHAEGLGSALSTEGAALAAVRAEKSAVVGDHLDRMTLTLAALKQVEFICLLMTGAEKRAAFETALRREPVEDMPVRAILRARTDLLSCWAP